MAKLIYFINMSLDGYIEDRDGRFDWTQPDAEEHRFINDLLRRGRTHLLGRRMYETMAVWETDPEFARGPDFLAEFASIWQAADKVVYSRILKEPWTARTRVERTWDAGRVRALKSATDGDIFIAGPNLASQALAAGLVDECHLMIAPVVVGGGKPAFQTQTRIELEPLEERRFPNGIAYIRYRVRD